jgi:SAM-dependent methyltransferase
MPTLAWNKGEWDERHEWPEDGDEWSIRWGGAHAQWLTTIWPRLASFLPTGSLLEIAPGHGRWTQYLLRQCSSYVGVDLSPSCVDACQKRFADQSHATFVANDGMTLPMVAAGSIDFVFTFDSLVHAESDAISSYLREFDRILSPDGVAFIHHSNVGIYSRSARWRDLLAKSVKPFPLPRAVLGPVGLVGWHNYRGRSMTAQRFATIVTQTGLVCPAQEVIAWSSPLLTDCISVVTRQGSRWDRPPTFIRNRYFFAAARSSRAAACAFQI